METSFLLAKIFGVLFVLVGLGLLFNLKYYLKAMEAFLADTGLLYFAAFIMVSVGMLIVLHHNIWIGGWPVLVTILGWATLVKGALFLLFPQWIVGMKKNMCTQSMCTFSGVLSLIVGLYLMYVSGMFLSVM
ncbi:hypothetical protein K9M59_02510 [Candidatus Gracilibacteria bacterium]|nr:hypothetical protein [Candidatus Gracilibacteria bacterium]MCF7819713.1 hypothetical protein [Candidatus Gracilibacteria bacterium]